MRQFKVPKKQLWRNRARLAATPAQETTVGVAAGPHGDPSTFASLQVSEEFKAAFTAACKKDLRRPKRVRGASQQPPRRGLGRSWD